MKSITLTMMLGNDSIPVVKPASPVLHNISKYKDNNTFLPAFILLTRGYKGGAEKQVT